VWEIKRNGVVAWIDTGLSAQATVAADVALQFNVLRLGLGSARQNNIADQ
jgi:hypothetical protein